MLKLSGTGIVGLAAVLAVLSGLLLGSPAVAGEVYSWQTEDGEVAYTDDPKKVPTRYRAQVSTRASEGLDEYERFTPADAKETSRYADQLAARLDRLRKLNGEQRAVSSKSDGAHGVASIRVRGMDLHLQSGDANEPIIIEQLRVRGAGQMATRHDAVVRQGNRILAIVRGRQEGESDAASSIIDEADLR